MVHLLLLSSSLISRKEMRASGTMILHQDSLPASNLDKKSSIFVPFLVTREWMSDETMKSHPKKEKKKRRYPNIEEEKD